MFDNYDNFIKKLASVTGFIIFLCIATPFIRNSFSHIHAINEADKGYITEKRYVPSSSFLFGYTETHYRIYISVYYDAAFGMKETEKYFVVEKEIFDQYKVGDFFDSTLI